LHEGRTKIHLLCEFVVMMLAGLLATVAAASLDGAPVRLASLERDAKGKPS
jgi:hypothetical protein